MDTKINTAQQVADLQVGDLLKRILPETLKSSNTDLFRIKSINTGNDMIGLVMTGNSVVLYGSPGEIGRLFIKTHDLLQQDIWWQCPSNTK